MRKWNYEFTVPDEKKIRMIVYTDAKNEADDQFTIAHHLMTPKFIVKGIIGAHFDRKPREDMTSDTAQESWGLGDDPTVGLLLIEEEKDDIYDMVEAPAIRYDDMSYSFEGKNRKIRVYKDVNPRLSLGDLFAKLQINYPERVD